MRISLNKIGRYVLLAAIIVAAAGFLYLVRVVLIPFAAALFLAFVLHPFVNFWERRALSRTAAILVVYFLFAGILSLVFIVGFPRLMAELNEFAGNLPRYAGDVNNSLDRLQSHYNRTLLPSSVRQVIDETVVRAEQGFIGFLRGTTGSILGFFSRIISIVFAPILAFYILKDAEYFRAQFLHIFPNTSRGDAYCLLRDIGRVLERFIRGELLVSAIIGILTVVGMLALGVKYALLIGLIAGIAELIPYFGPIVGAVPAIGFAMLKSTETAVYAAIVILLIQQLEGNLISPAILGESVGLHPLWVIFALLAGGELFGIWGLILAVPAAGIIKVGSGFVLRRLADWDSRKR